MLLNKLIPLTNAVAGKISALKCVIADANSNLGAVKVTELHVGEGGAEVPLTATVEELNALPTLIAELGDVVAELKVSVDKCSELVDSYGSPDVVSDEAGE